MALISANRFLFFDIPEQEIHKIAKKQGFKFLVLFPIFAFSIVIISSFLESTGVVTHEKVGDDGILLKGFESAFLFAIYYGGLAYYEYCRIEKKSLLFPLKQE